MGELRRTFEAQAQQQDWDGAQRTVDAANLQFPGSIFGPFLAGLLDLRRGDPDAAEQRLLAALRIAPRSPVLVATLGRVWSRKAGAAYAAGKLMALAERDPKLSIVRYIAARAYIEAGDPLRAEGALRHGLELQPDSPLPYQHLTDFDFGLDRIPEALQVAREGISRFPGSTDLQMMVGQIQAAAGHPEEAISTYRTLLGRRPDLDLARYRMAMLLASRTEPALHQEFLATLALLAKDRPSDPQLLDALGWMHHQAGRDDLARPLLELAVEHSADEPSTRFHLGSVYLASGAGERGREELQRAVDSPRPFPERLEAMRLLRNDPPRH
jgi:predicted Zn-dependent protease